jgi:drug/metabolite transporter (DMT)-like permease
MAAAPPVNRPMTAFEWALLLALSVLWGLSFFFVGVAVKELPPLTVVTLRVTIAALVLHAVIRVIGVTLPRTREAWTAFFGMAMLNNVVPFALISWGQTHIASALASILNATTPLLTVIVAHCLTADEKLTAGRVFGAIAGLVGIAIMIGGAAIQTLGIGVVAQLAILVAALSYALAGAFGRRFRVMGVTPLATATGQVTASSAILLPIMLVADQPWTLPVPSLPTIGALAGVALLSTALGYLLYFRILATAGATNLLLVTFLMPVTAILLGVGVLGEALQARHALGMALIGIGLAAVDGRLVRSVRRAITPAPRVPAPPGPI